MDQSKANAFPLQGALPAVAAVPANPSYLVEMPAAPEARHFRVGDCRDRWEKFYLCMIYVANVIVAAIVAAAIALLLITDRGIWLGPIILCIAALVLLSWISWKLFVALLVGNSIEAGPAQYPQIFRVVKQASDILGIRMPTVLILQGHGLFEIFVARRFSRRGFIIVTS